MKVYVAIMHSGEYEDHQQEIVYAGLSREDAIKHINNYKFPDDYGNLGLLEMWEHGILLGEEMIIG